MASTAYEYVIVDEFPNDVAEPEVLELEIAASDPAITSASLEGTSCDGDPQSPSGGTTLSVWFDDPLSGGDETQLDVLIAAHQGDQNKDIDTSGAALATTDKLILQKSDDKTDESIALSKDGSDNMLFQDGVQTTPLTLTQLAAGTGGVTESGHKTLRQLIHLAEDGGPWDGFSTAPYLEPKTAAPFDAGYVWYESSSKTNKIVEKTISRNANQTPSTIVWEAYDTDGSTVLVTATDTYAYTGSAVSLDSVTRTFS